MREGKKKRNKIEKYFKRKITENAKIEDEAKRNKYEKLLNSDGQ